MDLWQLTVFCKVVELESFSKAGNAIYLSQPTVSSHIKDLEESVGCQLIDRLPKKVLPTKAGVLLYGYAKKLLVLRDEAEAALAEFKGTTKGSLSIGGSTIPGVYLLPRIIGMFSKKYPLVKVCLVLGDTDVVAQKISMGDLEIGVVGAKAEEGAIHQELLFQDEMKLIVPFTHPLAKKQSVSQEELHKEPFIIRESGSGTLRSIQRGFEEGGVSLRKLNIIAEMGSSEAVRQAILANAGVSILSVMAVAEDIHAGRLVALKIQSVTLKQEFYLTTRHQRTISPLGSIFIDFLRANI